MLAGVFLTPLFVGVDPCGFFFSRGNACAGGISKICGVLFVGVYLLRRCGTSPRSVSILGIIIVCGDIVLGNAHSMKIAQNWVEGQH